MKQISLALTHYNRFDMVLQCVASVIDDPRIGEIVICDDASTDRSYQRLQANFAGNKKVKLFQNEKNLDCYRNKHQAVFNTLFEWVILFDSDNVISTDYLDRLYALPDWDPDVVYCPDWALPHFDYSSFGGLMVDCHNAARFVDRPHFCTALNTANYFFNRNTYLHVWKGDIDPVTADSIYHAYNWLRAEKKLFIVPGLRYFHRVHEGSHYKGNWRRTGTLMNEIKDKLRKLK